ncbi:MAG: M23 family metallopeptidase [Bacteroidetes bacterium]|nr:M23 family metallopeptidase [Bacteroidota bacterium]
MKLSSSILAFTALFSPFFALAQSSVEVTYTANDKREYTFQAKNTNVCDYTVKVEFTDLQGGSCGCSLPFIESISPGPSTLFTLKPNQNNQGISFRFGYSYLKGRVLNKAPKPFLYLFPFSSAVPHKAFLSKNIMEMIANKKVSNFYGIAFQMQKGDTVFAARRGVVSQVKDAFDTHSDGIWFSSQTNSVEIFHGDGSFASYNRLKKGKMLVKEGQEVEAGEPLGIVTDDTFEGSVVVQFSVYYLSRARAFNQTEYPYEFVVPSFYSPTNTSGLVMQSGGTYTSEWPEAMVTQEMSKKEIKRWKSKQK